MEWVLGFVVLVGLVALGMLFRRYRSIPAVPDTPAELFAAADRDAEGPGRLFGEADGVRFPGPRARAWAYGVLYEAGVDADADPPYAAGLLQRAQPQLTRAHADALVRTLL